MRLLNFGIRKNENKTCFQSEQKNEKTFTSVKIHPGSELSEEKECSERRPGGVP